MTTVVHESAPNGVDTATLFATIDAVKAAPEAARFQFRARNRWQNGNLSETTISSFSGAGTEQTHKTTFTLAGDHPAVVVGQDRAPLPGDIDLLGILGLSSDVRNGYQGIRASFSIKGDAPPETLQEIVAQSRARSAVFDVLTNGVPVSMSVNAG